MTYETLDFIADSFIPLAFALSLAGVFFPAGTKSPRARGIIIRVGVLIVLLALAYAVMVLDAVFSIWPYFGLDYSTHTAVYLNLSLFLCLSLRRYAYFWCVMLVVYLGLMRYQQYHSVADMLSTGLVLIFPALGIIYGLAAYCGPRHHQGPTTFFCQAFGEVPVFLRKTRAKAELSS